MYFVMAIRLHRGQVKNVLIPSHWCFGLNMEMVFKQGISQKTDFKIFFSKKRTKLPNFNLPVRNTFTNEDACYIARFKTCKNHMHAALDYTKKTRNVMPIDYASSDQSDSNEKIFVKNVVKSNKLVAAKMQLVSCSSSSPPNHMSEHNESTNKIGENTVNAGDANISDELVCSTTPLHDLTDNVSNSSSASYHARSEQPIVTQNVKQRNSIADLIGNITDSSESTDSSVDLAHAEGEKSTMKHVEQRELIAKSTGHSSDWSESSNASTNGAHAESEKSAMKHVEHRDQIEDFDMSFLSCDTLAHTASEKSTMNNVGQRNQIENFGVSVENGSIRNVSGGPESCDAAGDLARTSCVASMTEKETISELENIQNILSEDFEIEFFNFDPNTFPRPMNHSGDILIKAEIEEPLESDATLTPADPITFDASTTTHNLFGNMKYSELAGSITIDNVILRGHIVEILMSMNKHQNDVFNDRRFIFVLMLEAFDVHEMVNFNLENGEKNVLKGIFDFRCGENIDRIVAFDDHIQSGCTYFANKYR